MKELLANPDEHLNRTSGPFFRKISGDTTTVAVVTVDDKKLVLKRYNLKGFWYGVKKMFRQSRAMRSWKNSHYLEQHGINTPNAVAVVIQRFGPVRFKTYFLAEYVEGLEGRDIFAKDSSHRADWKKILDNVRKLLKELYAARITHDDFSHRNMLFIDGGQALFDLDHMRIHLYNSFWFRYNFRKDVDNFLRTINEINHEAYLLAKDILRQNQ